MKTIAVGSEHFDLLVEMNIRLRRDEKMDNVKTDAEVRDYLKFRLETTHRAYLFASDEGDTIGYAIIDANRSPKYLSQLFVEEKFRNQGYGSRIIDELMTLLETDILDVDVLVWNEDAIRFYRRKGFETRYTGMRLKKTGAAK